MRWRGDQKAGLGWEEVLGLHRSAKHKGSSPASLCPAFIFPLQSVAGCSLPGRVYPWSRMYLCSCGTSRVAESWGSTSFLGLSWAVQLSVHHSRPYKGHESEALFSSTVVTLGEYLTVYFNILLIYFYREEKGGGEGEKYPSVASHTCPTRNRICNPGIKPATFHFVV